MLHYAAGRDEPMQASLADLANQSRATGYLVYWSEALRLAQIAPCALPWPICPGWSLARQHAGRFPDWRGRGIIGRSGRWHSQLTTRDPQLAPQTRSQPNDRTPHTRRIY